MCNVKHMTPFWSPNFPQTSRNDVQPHDLTYEPFSACNFSHTKSCLRTVVWPTRRTTMRVHCEKTSLYTTFWLTWMCSHENVLIEARVCIQLVTQCPMLCSTDMFPRSVSTTRHIHVHVRALKDGCLYTFWLRKSCLCVTLNISHLVCHIIFHRCSRNKVQNHNFLTYEPFSLCNFWLTRTSPCANCHIGGRVCVLLTT